MEAQTSQLKNQLIEEKQSIFFFFFTLQFSATKHSKEEDHKRKRLKKKKKKKKDIHNSLSSHSLQPSHYIYIVFHPPRQCQY
jgi:hypothetical protein